MKQKDFLKIFIPCSINMPYILIQVNESIAKVFTLIIESPIEQSYGVLMQYLHHHGIFAFTMKHKNIFKYLIPHQYIMKFMFSKLFIHLTI
jgi:hypothetical protein